VKELSVISSCKIAATPGYSLICSSGQFRFHESAERSDSEDLIPLLGTDEMTIIRKGKSVGEFSRIFRDFKKKRSATIFSSFSFIAIFPTRRTNSVFLADLYKDHGLARFSDRLSYGTESAF